jgi:hypothetical protein
MMRVIFFEDTIEGDIHSDGGVSILFEATVEKSITIFREKIEVMNIEHVRRTIVNFCQEITVAN